MACDVLRGLAHVHNNNIIHKDIKGGNIIADTDGTYKIGDFGIAAMNSTINVSGGTFDTIDFGLRGTLHYMSPEQFVAAGGGSEENDEDDEHDEDDEDDEEQEVLVLDHRTDLWSLGYTGTGAGASTSLPTAPAGKTPLPSVVRLALQHGG